MSKLPASARLVGVDAVKRALVETTKFAMSQYEKRSGKELPEAVKTAIETFVDFHVGAMLPAILSGKMDKAVARDALIRCLKIAGVADDSGWSNCGIALFSIGVTAYDAAKTVGTASRVASIASASGVGAAPGAILVASTFLYGVFMITKDALDARTACDAAISKRAASEKRPAAVIDGKGYGVGSVAAKVGSQKGANKSLMH